MCSQYRIFTFVAISCFMIITVLSAKDPAMIQRNINENFLNLIARSGNLLSRNPCFTTYRADMKILNDKYEKDFDDCCADADSKRNITESNNRNLRDVLTDRAEMSCAALQQCSSEFLVNEMFQCYMDEGNEGAKVFHVISNNASSGNANYEEQLRVIESDENRCITKNKETYEYESAEAYDEYKACLSEKKTSPSPNPVPTTSTTTITS